MLPALQRGMRRCDARNFDHIRWGSFQLRHLKLRYACGEVSRTDVHLLCDIFRHDVDYELPGAANIARSIFVDRFVQRAVRHTDTDDRRIGTEVVVSTEWGGVERSILLHGCYQ